MEDHDVVGVVEVFGQCGDVLARQPVSHEDRRPVPVGPVDPVLKHKDNDESAGIQQLRGRPRPTATLLHTDDYRNTNLMVSWQIWGSKIRTHDWRRQIERSRQWRVESEGDWRAEDKDSRTGGKQRG